MKKALAMQELMLMILFVAVLLVFLVYNTKLGEIFKGKTPHDICKNSVRANAAANLLLGQFTDSITCPTEDIIITEKEDDKIKQRIADELADCWDAFGEGKLQLFGSQGTFCTVCSRVTFQKKGTLGHFTDWLATHNMPNKKFSYADYLLGFETEKVHEFIADASRFNINDPRLDRQIDMEQQYAAGVVYVRGEAAIDQFKDKVGNADFTFAGGVAGGTAGLIAAVALGSNPIGWVGLTLIGIGTSVGAVWSYAAGEKPQWLAITFFEPYTKETITRLGCQYAPAT